MNEHSYLTKFPIYTHLGIEILPANTNLNGTLISELQKSDIKREVCSSAYNTKLQKDIKRIFEKPFYEAIFRDKTTRDTIIDQLKRISFSNCIIDIIEYFKEYDLYTYEHFLSVYALSTHIYSLFLPQSKIIEEPLGSLFHDIGKCSIPLDILKKETPLTFNEREYIKHHTLAGYALINYFFGEANTNNADIIARDHHENKIGTGYPVGFELKDYKTQIVIVCDIYDALLSTRAYRKESFDNRTALEELTLKAENGEISKEIVQVLIACNRKSENSWNTCKISIDKRGTPPENNCYGIIADI